MTCRAAGTDDTVGVNHERTVFDVLEEKGRTSRLGTRELESGIRAQQGSTAYLNDLLHVDADVREYFRQNPGDVQRLIDGRMELQHHILCAKPDGIVWVERVTLNPNELHPDDLLPAPFVAGG